MVRTSSSAAMRGPPIQWARPRCDRSQCARTTVTRRALTSSPSILTVFTPKSTPMVEMYLATNCESNKGVFNRGRPKVAQLRPMTCHRKSIWRLQVPESHPTPSRMRCAPVRRYAARCPLPAAPTQRPLPDPAHRYEAGVSWSVSAQVWRVAHPLLAVTLDEARLAAAALAHGNHLAIAQAESR